MSVAFSPDGQTLAAGYGALRSGGVVLWDVANRQCRLEEPLPMRKGHVLSIAFSPDGNTLAAGDEVEVMLWDLALESWQRRAGQVANRNFTGDEWRQYFHDEPYRRTFHELPDGAGVAEARRAQSATRSAPAPAPTAGSRCSAVMPRLPGGVVAWFAVTCRSRQGR